VLAPDLQQTPNRTVDSSFFFLPRFSLSERFQIRASLPVFVEWTDTALTTTTTRREPRLGNLVAGLFYRGIPKVWGSQPLLGINVLFPTSKEVQAQSLVLAPSLFGQLAKPMHWLGGEGLFLASGSYQHLFYRYTTASVAAPPIAAPACFGGGESCALQLSGVSNVSDSINWAVTATMEWGSWSPGAQFRMVHGFLYGFSELEGVERIDRPAAVRNSTFFSLWLDYLANDWLTAEVGVQLNRPILDGSGRYGNPLFAQYQEGARLYLAVNFGLDALAKIVAGGDAKGGVVRASRGGPLQL
jgi:hypothetical protein